MLLDIEEIFGNTIGRIIVLFLFLVSAIWFGSIVGCIARTVGDLSLWRISPSLFFELLGDFLKSPVYLINLWIVPNVGVLAIIVVILFVSEDLNHRMWGIILGFESLFFMLGTWGADSGRRQWVSWISWGILLAMVETGIWLTRKMITNRWARDLAELRAENAMIRAEREAQRASEESEGRRNSM